jgi:hypothetical protein
MVRACESPLWAILALCAVSLPLGSSLVHASRAIEDTRQMRQLLQTRPVSVRTSTKPANSLYPNTPALFAFGDGDYDVGNVLFMGRDLSTDSYPYGSSFYNITGRNSDGRIIPDFFGELVG